MSPNLKNLIEELAAVLEKHNAHIFINHTYDKEFFHLIITEPDDDVVIEKDCIYPKDLRKSID